MRSSETSDELLELSVAQIVADASVRAAYQPIVELSSGRTVGYEALARGPEGSTFERPDVLFAEAQRAGLLAELEWECRRAALQGALDGGLDSSQALFMNVEPSVLSLVGPASLQALIEEAAQQLSIFVELTERALTADPPSLLRAVDWLRTMGFRIALDDVGVDARSLALMPFLAPEMIKLDLALVQQNPSAQIAEIVHAVGAQAERTGAMVLAEGIETEKHLEQALALGARYGQGWLFGRPGTLPTFTPGSVLPIPSASSTPAGPGQTAFELVTEHKPTRRGNKRLLLALSRQIEAQTSSLGATAVLLSTFQEAGFFSQRTAALYSSLAERAALVAALGVGIGPRPAPRVRGVALDHAEPLRGEWNVIVLGPHFAAAFVAQDLGDNAPDMERRFDFVLTYERDIVVRAATAMMSRIARA